MRQVVSLMKRFSVHLNPEAKLDEDDEKHLAERPIWRPPLHKLVSFVSSNTHNIGLTNNERKLILFDYPLVMEREEKKRRKEQALSSVKKRMPTPQKTREVYSKLLKGEQPFVFEWIEGNHQIVREKKAAPLLGGPLYTKGVLEFLKPLRCPDLK